MNYAFKTFKKIDVYLKNIRGYFVYECSTNASKTCKEAKARYLNGIGFGLDKTQVKCLFSK